MRITLLIDGIDGQGRKYPPGGCRNGSKAGDGRTVACGILCVGDGNAEDVQDPLEPYAQAVYDAVLQQQGFSFEVCYNAKGNFYLQLGEQEQAGKTYAYTLVYNRTSQNGKCEIFVLYRNPEENLSTEAAQIVEFYAVRSEDLQVIAGDKTGWSVVANSAYQEATGEK